MSAFAWPLVVLTVSLLVLWRVDRWAALIGANAAGRLRANESNIRDLSENVLAVSIKAETAHNHAQVFDAWRGEMLARVEKLETELRVSPPSGPRHTAETLRRFK